MAGRSTPPPRAGRARAVRTGGVDQRDANCPAHRLGDAIACTLDGAAASCTSPVALDRARQGTHTYRATESDLVATW
jgi:hypothetical protein